MLSLFSLGRSQFFDANGDPLSGGLLYTYSPGTTTPKATYADKDGGTPNSNPIELDARGEAEIWLDGIYKFVLKDSSGATIWTADNQFGIGNASQYGTLTKNVGGSANVTLSASESSARYILLSGALAGNISVIVGDDLDGYFWVVKNATSGAYTVTFKTASGTGVILTQGLSYNLYCDSSNVVKTWHSGTESGNQGTSRPADVVSGGLWIDTDFLSGKWGIYRYNGSADVLEGVLTTATGIYAPVNGYDIATVTPPTDADVTLTADQYYAGSLTLVNGAWTTGHSIIVPAERRTYFVDNSAGSYDALVKTAAGSGVTVVAGTRRILQGGTNVTDPLSAYYTAQQVLALAATASAVITGTSNTTFVTPLAANTTLKVQSSATVASTSGTSIDFTSIPAGVKKITVMWSGVSTSGTSNHLIQIGTASGIENSGYLGAGSYTAGAATASANYTAGFGVNASLAADVIHGCFTLDIVDDSTNLWACSYSLGASNSAATFFGGGSKALSGVLDRVRVTNANGTDTFDAGKIRVMWEF